MKRKTIRETDEHIAQLEEHLETTDDYILDGAIISYRLANLHNLKNEFMPELVSSN